MNRQERRKLIKEREKLLKRIKSHPMTIFMEPLIKGRRGTGGKEILKALCLGVEANPEPIVVQYSDFNKKVFDEVGHQLLMPTVCYEQKADGSIERVIQNGKDITFMSKGLMEASRKDFALWGQGYSDAELLIETIKALNCVIESLGGAYLDTTHAILSHRSFESRRADREVMMKYWGSQYGTLRHVVFNDLFGGSHE